MFDKVIGYDGIKAELAMLVDVIKNPEKYDKLNIDKPGGIMLYGEPGLGKTLLAQEFCEESGVKIVKCMKTGGANEFVEDIKSAFDEAINNQPSIVFLDDLDKFSNEDELRTNTDEYITCQSCIDFIKDKQVYVIATANFMENFPISLTRHGRFDTIIEITPPTYDDAVKIIKFYLESKNEVVDFSPEEIARLLQGYSCATLESVIKQAAIYAGYRGGSFIEKQDFIKSCLRVLFNASEASEDRDEQTRRLIAFHEAGHAFISEFYKKDSVSMVSIANHGCSINGFSSSYYNQYAFETDSDLYFIKLQTLLAGKACTELFYKKFDAGCSSDIHTAERIIDSMNKYNAAFGLNSIVDSGAVERDLSSSMKRSQDKIITKQLNKNYKIAKRLIRKNKKVIYELVHVLLEKETLTRTDLDSIFYKYKFKGV